MLCAVAFAAHIVSLARFAPRHAVVPFTAIQLLVVAVLGLVASAVFEGLPLPVASVLPALIGTGVVVSAGAFMLHVSAQRVIGPSRTAIVLSAEPVFAAATAAVVLGERLTVRGWLGAALIMAGVYVVLAFAPPEEADSIVANHRDRGSLTGVEPTNESVADRNAAKGREQDEQQDCEQFGSGEVRRGARR